jgi:hypothetical protein
MQIQNEEMETFLSPLHTCYKEFPLCLLTPALYNVVCVNWFYCGKKFAHSLLMEWKGAKG